MNKKTVTIIIGSCIGILLLVGAILIIVNQQSSPASSQSAYRYDTKQHIGVGSVLAERDVTAALGSLGKDVQGPELSGTAYVANNRAETATYTFNTTSQKKVKLQIDAMVYTSANALKSAEVFRGAQAEKISGVGEEAHLVFPADDPSRNEREYALVAVKGLKSYVFMITVSTEGQLPLTRAAAKDVLIALGRKAQLDSVR